MSAEFEQPGNILDFTVGSGGVEYGDIVMLNDNGLMGVCLDNGEEGDVIAVGVEGVFRNVPSISGALDAFAPVYWNGTALTGTASTNPFVGFLTENSPSGQTHATVKLTPTVTT